MEGAPTLGWSIPNLVTVTLMVVLSFALIGLGVRGFRAIAGAKSGADMQSVPFVPASA